MHSAQHGRSTQAVAVCGAYVDPQVESERLCLIRCVSRSEPFRRDAEANVLVVAKLPAIDQQSRSRIRLITPTLKFKRQLRKTYHAASFGSVSRLTCRVIDRR